LAIAVDSVDSLAEKLRSVKGSPAVIARIENNRLLLDPRTVLPEQDGALVTALKEALLK
jgi:L-seryl-tRNA(Ser) seleniumtransferase